ncbi:MAG: hypothetical protein OEV92_08745, partial [Nitrospinota bacterium]|nr:hypothetical protein [Nitrospinota bacterium]
MTLQKIYKMIASIDMPPSRFVLIFSLILVVFVGWYGCSDSYLLGPDINEHNKFVYKYLNYMCMAIPIPFICAFSAGAILAYYYGIPDEPGSNITVYRYISRALLFIGNFIMALEWQLCLMNVSVSIVPYYFFMVMIASMSFHIAS